MIRGETSYSIPIDVIIEILSRLPMKSITRFRCIPKLWGSMLHRPYFTELLLTSSRARPKLVFAIERAHGWRFYSSLQPQNPYEKSSSVVVAADYTKFFRNHQWKSMVPPKTSPTSCRYASGLVYISSMWMSKEDTYAGPVICSPSNGQYAVPVICNPSTGQYAILPEGWYIGMYSFLGFDPIGKKYKVLLSKDLGGFRDHRILTLGTGTMTWRDIHCPLPHTLYCPRDQPGICINGVLYYLAKLFEDGEILLIVCFDIRSEKFKFIKADSCCRNSPKLINYKGKLGGIGWAYVDASDGRCTLELSMWVLEDVEKQEWSKNVYPMPDNEVFGGSNIIVAGVTTRGEIVFSKDYRFEKSFYVFYFNPERNTLQTVENQGFGEYNETFDNCSRFNIFVDHVEDFNFIA